MIPVHVEEFWHDGRGPELLGLHWDSSGTILLGADYHNPDRGSTTPVRRVRFARAQVASSAQARLPSSGGIPRLDRHRPAWDLRV